MIPVIWQTIRQRRWFTFWWAVGIIALLGVTLAVYPSIRNQTSQLDQSFANLPDSVKSLFTDTTSFFTPIGYLSSQVFYLMLPLLFSILSIGLGSSVLAREEQDGTLELLLSRPISRTRLLLAKMAGALSIIAIVGAIGLVSCLVLCRIVDIDVSWAGVSVTYFLAWLLGLFFGSIAFSLTALGRAARLASIGIAALVGLAAYLISSLESLASWLEWPAKLLPYHYYHPAKALAQNYEWGLPVALGLAIITLTVTAILGFRRRDIG